MSVTKLKKSEERETWSKKRKLKKKSPRGKSEIPLRCKAKIGKGKNRKGSKEKSKGLCYSWRAESHFAEGGFASEGNSRRIRRPGGGKESRGNETLEAQKGTDGRMRKSAQILKALGTLHGKNLELSQGGLRTVESSASRDLKKEDHPESGQKMLGKTGKKSVTVQRRKDRSLGGRKKNIANVKKRRRSERK